MNRLALEVVAILGLAFLGAACIIVVGGQNAVSRPPVQPAAQAAPTAMSKAATLADIATPKPSEPKPTAPPAPPPSVLITGRFEPTLLRVGQKLVVELILTNRSAYPLGGIRYVSSGPWEKYTVVSVLPSGRYEHGFVGHNFSTDEVLPVGQSGSLFITAYPNEPGSHEFTFIPYNATTQKLRDEMGVDIVIGGKVNVTR